MPAALIADDEPHLADYLRGKLAALWPELTIVAVAANGPQAAAAIAEHRPDVAFLDIRMPGATGIEVAQQLRGGPHRPHVVFVTAYDRYAIEAFDADAVDYLLKPVTDERLARAVEKLRMALGTGAPPLSGEAMQALLRQLSHHLQTGKKSHLRWIRASKRSSDGGVTEQISVADVAYIQADDKYTCVYARDGSELREWLIRVPLSDLAAQLDPADFAQVHRSVIVNLHAVAGTRRDLTGKLFIRIRDHARELPVARQYVHLFRQM
jgi:DNA-binding LytR/AlgR family response regulator